MKKIAILLLLLFSLESMAQTYQENLEKYWFFRHKLKTKFMDIDNNAGNTFGTFLPAECRSDTIIRLNEVKVYDEHYIRWGDTPWNLGHYIAALALEYRLLKDNGQNCDNTLYELNVALNTYDRLDLHCEHCFDNGSNEWNGFFLRDDVRDLNRFAFPRNIPVPNLPEYDYLTLDCGYIPSCNENENNVISQDQAILLFLGLKVAKELVDDDYTQLKVGWISDAIVSRLHEYKFPFKWWRIRNPVTENIVPAGGTFWNLLPFSWALAESATKITTDQHYGYSDDVQSLFNTTQSFVLFNYMSLNIPMPDPVVPSVICGFPLGQQDYLLEGSPFNAYLTAVLSVLTNEYVSPSGNTYDWLIQLYNDTKGKMGMPHDVGLYPHLPILSEIINGYNGNNKWSSQMIEEDFLNTSPECGAHHYVYIDLNGNTVHSVTAPPWHTMGINHPQHNNGNWRFDGEYNNIDYMLLYNAYFYVYHSKNGHKPYVYLEDLINKHSNFYASRQIDAKTIINGSNIIVSFSAGSKVILKPGFKTESCSKVLVQIREDLCDYYYYSETNTNTCLGGSFEPVVINNGSKIDTKHDFEAYFEENEYNSKSQNDNLTDIRNNNVIESSDVYSSTVYPNPSNGVFQLQTNERLVSVSIFNIFGDLVYNKLNVDNDIIKFDLSKKSNGFYYLVTVSKTNTETHKLIKE